MTKTQTEKFNFDLPSIGLASTDPCAILFEAYLKHSRKEFTFYDYIKCIGDMRTAIDGCLKIASQNQSVDIQKAFLKAASMGIRLCERYDISRFVEITRKLRVINALRKLNIQVSFDEFHVGTLLDRLISKEHWPLAIEICNYLDVPMEDGIYKILAHWCLSMMDSFKQGKDPSLGEEALAQKIFDRLQQYPSISYADIAEVAARNKLPNLATMLLGKETQISRQVVVLLKLDQIDKALLKAVQSQQPDLVHLVLRRMKEVRTSHEIELFLGKIPQVMSLYQSYLFEEVSDRVLALYEQNDDFVRQAIYYLKKAEECTDFFDTTRLTEQLSKAEKSLQMLKYSTMATLVASSSQLIVDNAIREEKFSISFTDKSVRETYIWAAANEQAAIMESLKKQHKLSDKQSFLWHLEGLAQSSKWNHFEQFLRSQKSPFGYLPVIEVCCRHKNVELGRKFIEKVVVYEEQI